MSRQNRPDGPKGRIKLNKSSRRLLILLGLLLLTLGLIAFFFSNRVTDVQILDSEYYAKEDIEADILSKPFSDNSILAPLLYSEDVTNIPFIKGIRVTRENAHTISITALEDAPVGCTKYLDCYVYFNYAGKVLLTEPQQTYSAPFFTGMGLKKVVQGETLKIKNDTLLVTAANLSKLFSKNDVMPDSVTFNEKEQTLLQYEGITVNLGSDEKLEDKMDTMLSVLPTITGQTGILHLESLSEGSQTVTFERTQ
ncbi:MAG: cell division protein FtsQ/DivIB [Lachnospiraceae bacterium]